MHIPRRHILLEGGDTRGSSLPCGLETKKSGHLIKDARMHALWLDRSP